LEKQKLPEDESKVHRKQLSWEILPQPRVNPGIISPFNSGDLCRGISNLLQKSDCYVSLLLPFYEWNC
jgi:hypothetical protein